MGHTHHSHGIRRPSRATHQDPRPAPLPLPLAPRQALRRHQGSPAPPAQAHARHPPDRREGLIRTNPNVVREAFTWLQPSYVGWEELIDEVIPVKPTCLWSKSLVG